MTSMRVEKILCRNGHLLGLITDGEITVKHMGRKLCIALPEREPLTLRITCDRCGEEKSVCVARKT